MENFNIDQLTITILDAIPQMVFVKDLGGKFVYSNQQLRRFFQMSPSELYGKSDADLIRPVAIESYKADDFKVVASGMIVEQEELLYGAKGEQIYVKVKKQPIFLEGEIKYVLGVVTPISNIPNDLEAKIKQLEEKDQLLKDTQQQLREYQKAAEELNGNKASKPPKVFVSYKHSDGDHVEWVGRFSRDLMEIYSIDCFVDQFDLDYGNSIPEFMQKIQTDVTHVLLIITPQAVAAIQSNSGGVAFESQLAATLRAEGQLRLIPVLRSGNQTPAYVKSHLYIDFRDDKIYLDMLKLLADSIRGVKRKPELGSRGK